MNVTARGHQKPVATFYRSSGGCNSTYWGAFCWFFPARCRLAFPKFGLLALQAATIC